MAVSLSIFRKRAAKAYRNSSARKWQNHKDLSCYAQELEAYIFKSYYKFAIVRNPWDRLVSDYNYQKWKRSEANHRLLMRDQRGRNRSFKQWLEAALSDPFCYQPAAWGADVSQGIHRWSPQVDWISVSGNIAVDRILRMENLQEDFAELCCTLGLPSRELPCRNWRYHRHYSYYYSESTRRLVEEYYEKDIETFGYRFDSPGGPLRSVFPERIGIRIRTVICGLVQSR